MAGVEGGRGHTEYGADQLSDASKRRVVFVAALALGSVFALFQNQEGLHHSRPSAMRATEDPKREGGASTETKIPRLWEQQGPITLGMPVSVEILDTEGQKREVTMRFCSADEGEEKGTTYINGQRFRLLSLKFLLRLPIKVNAVRMNGGSMSIEGEAGGVAGRSQWTPESLQQFLQDVLRGEEPTFPMDSDWGKATGKIERAKASQEAAEIATSP
jgi:hypothetical protein